MVFVGQEMAPEIGVRDILLTIRTAYTWPIY